MHTGPGQGLERPCYRLLRAGGLPCSSLGLGLLTRKMRRTLTTSLSFSALRPFESDFITLPEGLARFVDTSYVDYWSVSTVPKLFGQFYLA